MNNNFSSRDYDIAIVTARMIAGCLVITIPKSIRDGMQLEPKDKVLITLDSGRLIIDKITHTKEK